MKVTDDLRVNHQPPPAPEMSNHGGVTVTDRTEAKTTTYLRIIEEEECNSSSSSSIGNNSDDDDDGDDAQSPYRFNDDDNNQQISTGSLDDAIQALEKALPIRRGISTFYDGKSKSFTCLANMLRSSTPSVTDIAKPDNGFNRKRRNLLASTLLCHKNKNRAFQLSDINTGRISKKPKTTPFHFASEREDNNLQSPNLSSMRSFSMVNLHRCSSRFGLKSTEIENC